MQSKYDDTTREQRIIILFLQKQYSQSRQIPFIVVSVDIGNFLVMKHECFNRHLKKHPALPAVETNGTDTKRELVHERAKT